MAYKVVIDAPSNISKNISDRLKSFNISTSSIDNNMSDASKASYIKEYFGTGNNIIVISSRINTSNNGIEIIYPLRSNSRLASDISAGIENMGGDVTKYYQKRNSSDTSKDDDYLIRNTPNNQTIVIYYDNISDYNLSEGIVKGVVEYTGLTYLPPILDGYYVVKKGDTLWSIANKNNTTVDKLKKENNLTSNILSVGQVLKLPTTQDITNSNQLNYVVKKGDTLWSIANKYNTTVDKIKVENNLSSNLLSIGQELVIPSSSKYSIYTVKKGDSLYSIARSNNTTVSEIKRLNNLSSDLISINQKLLIPA